MFSINQLTLTKKLAIVPVFLVAMLITLGVLSYFALTDIDNRMRAVTEDLAPESDLTSSLLQEIYRLRLTVKTYVKTGSSETAAEFSAQDIKTRDILAKAKAHIDNPERTQMLEQIIAHEKEYVDIFNHQVVTNQQQRAKLVTGILDVKGPEIEKIISQIMQSSFTDGDVQGAFFAGKNLRELLLARLYVSKFLLDNQADQAQRFRDEIVNTHTTMDELAAALDNLSYQSQVKQAAGLLSEYEQAANGVFEAINNRNQAIVQLDNIGIEMAQITSDLQDNTMKSLSEAGDIAAKEVSQKIIFINIILLIAILLSAFITVIVTQSLLRTIREVVALLNEIADGEADLTQRLPVNGHDELTQLAKNFNRFVLRIQQLVAEVKDTTVQMVSASTQLNSVTHSATQDMSSQQNETQLVASAITEMAASAVEVAASADTANKLSEDAKAQALLGRETVTRATHSMRELASKVEASATTIEQLRNDSDKIGAVLDVIRAIAEQTNLLALNAAIEAARAGEQGRGFAVVADEVRSLASRTQESTKQIQQIIQTLQDRSGSAATMMGQSREATNSTVEQVTQVESALSTITEMVMSITHSVSQMAHAAEQQSTVVEEINMSINSVNDSANRTLTGVKQAASSANGLLGIGQQLDGLVSEFKV
ncbi:methyl-accepting chemotaxis protein [Shewanella decolorationis]|uniref:Methyl-accepting chemotaxis sensory transducer n=1 Tax=Shewanella decolorationis S12 TaxID=1353536 RepID=A0ABP2Z8E6_9GAMM|nr:methyl-accepting chemotaxis protein [Shewanella decolorationis]ESE41997.1 methyl-accepting chemotaxis sensory transducer [Shewanella decolorationis S12]GLR34404.1 methyl-accepting chemotaxis protein [Shewanella decolorationis]